MKSISWYEYYHWQPDEGQGTDYQYQFSIIPVSHHALKSCLFDDVP